MTGNFPGLDHVFIMWDPLANRPYRGMVSYDDNPSQLELNRRGVELGAYDRGFILPGEPVVIVRHMGERQPGDVIWTSDFTPLIVSERVLEVLAPFSGWTTYPVVVLDGDGVPVPGYTGLAVTGRCGRVYPDLTRIEQSRFLPEYVGLVLNPNIWDGSDIFYPINFGGRFITEAVHYALKRAKIRNLRFERPREMRFIKESIDRERRDRVAMWCELDIVDYESLLRVQRFYNGETASP